MNTEGSEPVINIKRVRDQAQQSKALGRSDGKLCKQLASATTFHEKVVIITQRIKAAKTLEDIAPDGRLLCRTIVELFKSSERHTRHFAQSRQYEADMFALRDIVSTTIPLLQEALDRSTRPLGEGIPEDSDFDALKRTFSLALSVQDVKRLRKVPY
jgi:hypothetical protein